MDPIKYCPTCGAELGPYPIKDIYLSGLSCPNKHFFFKSKRDVLSIDSLKAKSRPSPSSDGGRDLEVIEYWLTDEGARATLNDQIAVILRRIYEILKDRRHISREPNVFVFCPLCRMPLKDFDEGDSWQRGQRCNNSHEYRERGGTVDFWIEGTRANLSEEMPDVTLMVLLECWLKGDRLSETQLHGEIKKILSRFKERMDGS